MEGRAQLIKAWLGTSWVLLRSGPEGVLLEIEKWFLEGRLWRLGANLAVQAEVKAL